MIPSFPQWVTLASRGMLSLLRRGGGGGGVVEVQSCVLVLITHTACLLYFVHANSIGDMDDLLGSDFFEKMKSRHLDGATKS